jgi:tRNA pseudouridine38-40 synthase
MNRYFLELSYHGAGFAGFQVQKNAVTVQSEVEKALAVYFRGQVALTGSSRTDAGVHAMQNYFHFDWEEQIDPRSLYNLNAILPSSIVLKRVVRMPSVAHSRFDAVSREYKYFLYREKDPFLEDRAYYYPYALDEGAMQEAAVRLKGFTDFTSFSKRNTQVHTFECRVMTSEWRREGKCLVYKVEANRFLRGMVRGLVATMLQVGRGKMSLAEFERVFELKDNTRADFAVPGHGLFLMAVNYPAGYFEKGGEV